jgi:hypothetical protein
MDEAIYKYDLENRFPTYTFNETTVNDMHKFDAIDGATTVSTATKLTLAEAVYSVRTDLVGGTEVLPMLTMTQIGLLTSIDAGTNIYNSTSGCICECNEGSRNIIYVNSSNASSVLPGYGTGTITLAANTIYMGNNDTVVVTDTILFSSDSRIENMKLIITTATTGLTTGTAESIEIKQCEITYTGTGTLFNIADLGSNTVLEECIFYMGGAGQTVFNITSTTDPNTFLILDLVIFAGSGNYNMGTIDGSFVTINNTQFLGFLQGVSFQNTDFVNLSSMQTTGANAASTHFSFEGTTQGGVQLNGVNITIQSNEYGFNFNPGTTFSSTVSVLGCVIEGATNNVFESGSYESSDNGFKFIGNSHITDSSASAYINALDQSAVQTILDQSVAKRITATYTEQSAERFTTSTNGSILYTGTENINLGIGAPITGTMSSGTGIQGNFYVAIGNTGTMITSFADAGGGQVTVNTAAAHGFSNGDRIIIEDTTNYDYEYTISGVTTTSYEITATWVSTETGNNYKVLEFTKATNQFSGLDSNTSLIASTALIPNDVLFLCVENTGNTAEWETSDIQFRVNKI